MKILKKQKMNKNILLINLLCLLCYFSGCSVENEQNKCSITTIDLEEAIDSKIKGKSLSDFCDTIIYVPLETNRSCMIDDIEKIVLYEEDIFVMDRYGLYKFDQYGKFICKIGDKGRGPEEYNMLANFFIKTNTIYVRGWNKIFAYNTNSGIFLYSIQFDDKYPKTYINKTEKYFVSFNYTNNLIEYYDIKGNLIDSAVYSKNDKMILDRAITFPYYNLFFGTDTSLKFTTYCNDTIFEVNEKYNLIPQYIIKLGKYKIPEKFRPDVASWDLFYNNASSYLRKIPLETTRLLLIQLGHWKKPEGKLILPEYSDKKAGISGLAIYNKMDNKISIIKKDEEKLPCFYPNFTDGKNHLLSFVNALDAIAAYNQHTYKNQVNTSFVKAVQNLKIDDNPIIIIAELKN